MRICNHVWTLYNVHWQLRASSAAPYQNVNWLQCLWILVARLFLGNSCLLLKIVPTGYYIVTIAIHTTCAFSGCGKTSPWNDQKGCKTCSKTYCLWGSKAFSFHSLPATIRNLRFLIAIGVRNDWCKLRASTTFSALFQLDSFFSAPTNHKHMWVQRFGEIRPFFSSLRDSVLNFDFFFQHKDDYTGRKGLIIVQERHGVIDVLVYWSTDTMLKVKLHLAV